MLDEEYRLRVLAEVMADPEDPRHGKSSTYTIGCRCDKCRAARRDYARKYRRARDAVQETMNRYSSWSIDDFKTLNDYYGRVPTAELVGMLHHPVSTITTYACKMGLTNKEQRHVSE